MISDPIADLLIRIKNAYMAKHQQVLVPHSNLKENLLKIILKYGYIKAYKTFKVSAKASQRKSGSISGGKKTLEIQLSYPKQSPAIIDVLRISKPGVRLYVNTRDLSKYLKGRGITIISTSKGLLTAKEAKKQKIAGEVICKII